MPDLKDLCPVRRAHWKSFKLDLKREEDKTSLDRDKPGGSTSMFGGCCANMLLKFAASVAGVEMDGDPHGSKDADVSEVLEITQVCENGHARLKASTPKRAVGTTAQMKCYLCQCMQNGQ